jgi:predicted ATP-grasp superfamily ATP-dependent carboligase
MAGAETVLLLGTGQRAAQAAARSLGRAGFQVHGGSDGGRLYGRTRYCTHACRIPPPSVEGFDSALRELVERSEIDAILPLSDEHLGALLMRPDVSSDAVVVGPTRRSFERLGDKVGLLTTSAAVGVQSPPSVVVQPGEAIGELPGLPAYVKVASSVYAGIPAGRPLRVTSRSECVDAVEMLRRGGSAVLVQEEVLGRHWRFHFARDGRSLASVAAVQLADYPHRVGQSTVLQYCATPPRLRELSHALLDAVDYTGVGSIQWVERDGEFLVHDVNLRLPAAVAGTIANGLDMPLAAVELALRGEWRSEATNELRVRYVWFPGELMALRQAIRGGTDERRASSIAASLVLGAISPRRVLVPFDLKDPLPTLAGVAEAVRATRRANPA